MQDKQKGKKFRPLDGPGPPLEEISFYRPKRRSDLSVRVVDGEEVVLDRDREVVHQFNQTASFIWDCCDGKNTVAGIVDQLAEAFAIDPESAARDVAKIVKQIEKLNLLEP